MSSPPSPGPWRASAPSIAAPWEPLGYLADAPAPLHLVAAITGLDEQGLGRLLEECRRQSVLSVADGRVEVHALTVAAIAATNGQGSLAEALARYQDRLNSINLDDPVALREELAHHESIHSQARETLGVEAQSVLAYANSLGNGYSLLGRVQGSVKIYEIVLEIN